MTDKLLTLSDAIAMGKNDRASAQNLEEACLVVQSAKILAEQAVRELEGKKETSIGLVVAGDSRAINELAVNLQEAQIRFASLQTALSALESRLQRRREADEAAEISAQWKEVRVILDARLKVVEEIEKTVLGLADKVQELYFLGDKALNKAPLQRSGLQVGIVRRELMRTPFWDKAMVPLNVRRFASWHGKGLFSDGGASTWGSPISLMDSAALTHNAILQYADIQEEPELPEAA